MFQTLSARATAILVVATLFTVAIVVGIEEWIHEPREQQTMARSQQLLTHQVARLMERTVDRTGYEDALHALLDGAEIVQSVRIVAADGTIIQSARAQEIGDRVEPPLRASDHDNPRRIEGHRAVLVREPLAISGRPDAAVLEMRLDSSAFEEGYRAERAMLFAIVGLQVGVFFLVWLLLRRFLIRPTRVLLGSMQRVAAGDLTERVRIDSPSEFADLGKTFNAMVEKLDSANRRLEKYYADSMARAERLATMGELTTAMSHEIKNPLAGLSGALHVLRTEPGLESHREVLDEMASTVERLDKTTRDLLSYGRSPEVHLAAHSANECVQSVVYFLGKRPGAVELCVDLAADLPDVWVDSQQLQQVLLNLGVNALQAMQGEGRLTVRTRRDERGVAIELADTGPGIPEDRLERVFDPFFTTKPSGTGLGLTISKQLIDGVGGSIHIESSEAGTVVRVSVPVAEPELREVAS